LLTSLALKKYLLEQGHHNKGKKAKLAPQYGIGGTKIIMKSENGDVLSFPSINDSATRQQFRVRFTTISLNVNQNKPILIKGVKWFVFS